MPTRAIVLAIPYDVLSHICHFLDIASLKHCRLVNHLLESPARAALFATIHVTTTVASLNHATCIGRSPKLCKHVRALAYHASTIISSSQGSLDEPTAGRGNGPRNFVELQHFLEVTHDHEPWCSIPYDKDALKLWQDCTAIYAARRDLESYGYVSQRLRALLAYFPNIASIHLLPVTPNAIYVPGEHMPYLSRVDEDAFTDVLSACCDMKHIRSLTARNLHWGSFRPCHDLRPLCEGLRRLDVHIHDLQIRSPYSYMREELAAFLGQCQNLELLVLDINTKLRLRDPGFENFQAVCNSVLFRTWTMLTQVHLTGFMTTASRIESFIDRHSRSLQSVKLERLTILIPANIRRSASTTDVDEYSATLDQTHGERHYLRSIRVDDQSWHRGWSNAGGLRLSATDCLQHTG